MDLEKPQSRRSFLEEAGKLSVVGLVGAFLTSAIVRPFGQEMNNPKDIGVMSMLSIENINTYIESLDEYTRERIQKGFIDYKRFFEVYNEVKNTDKDLEQKLYKKYYSMLAFLSKKLVIMHDGTKYGEGNDSESTVATTYSKNGVDYIKYNTNFTNKGDRFVTSRMRMNINFDHHTAPEHNDFFCILAEVAHLLDDKVNVELLRKAVLYQDNVEEDFRNALGLNSMHKYESALNTVEFQVHRVLRAALYAYLLDTSLHDMKSHIGVAINLFHTLTKMRRLWQIENPDEKEKYIGALINPMTINNCVNNTESRTDGWFEILDERLDQIVRTVNTMFQKNLVSEKILSEKDDTQLFFVKLAALSKSEKSLSGVVDCAKSFSELSKRLDELFVEYELYSKNKSHTEVFRAATKFCEYMYEYMNKSDAHTKTGLFFIECCRSDLGRFIVEYSDPDITRLIDHSYLLNTLDMSKEIRVGLYE
jgi:hypothetical protein